MSASPLTRATCAVALATRHGDPSKILTARQNLNAARIEDALERCDATLPPLRPEQRQALAERILAGGAA